MNITPTLVVLLQELERFNKLVNLMSQTLSLLRKALAGEIGMGSVLDEVAGALYNGQIPNYWRKLAPDTTKSLAYWIEHLNQRANQYRYWASSGEPLVMWLSGLHMPQSFLTALVQIACRKNNWPLDRSTLFTEVTHFADPDDVEERPESVSEVGGHPKKKHRTFSLGGICNSILVSFFLVFVQFRCRKGMLRAWSVLGRRPLVPRESMSGEVAAEGAGRTASHPVHQPDRSSPTEAAGKLEDFFLVERHHFMGRLCSFPCFLFEG